MPSVFEIIFKATGLDSIAGAIRGKLGSLVTLAGAWRAASAAFGNYLEKQDALADLDSGLERAGQLTEEYREKLMGLADEMERTAGIADDKMLSAMGRLARDGMDPARAGATADALKNLAALMGGDVNQAAIMLGKAMHGNFDSFSRLGIKAKDLDGLFRELAARGGGLLEARMQTLGGQMKNLQNAAADMGEAVAGAFVKILTGDSEKQLTRRLEMVAHAFRYMGEQADVAGDILANVIRGEKWSNGSGLDQVRAKLATAEEKAKRLGQTVKETGQIMAEAFSPFMDELSKMAAQQQEIIDANADMAEALVNKAEAEGTIQPEEASRKRDQIRIQAERDRLRNEMDAAALARDQANRVINAPGATPEQREAALKAKSAAEDTLGRRVPKERSIEARDITSEAQFDKAKEERDIRLNEEADRARRKRDELADKALKMADAAPMVTEADAIAAIEAGIKRTLTNQEVRYRKMTGEIQKVMDRLSAGRA